MTNAELLCRMQDRTADLEYLEELETALRAETEKDVSEQDLSRIAELTEAISAVCCTEDEPEDCIREGISRLKAENRTLQPRARRIRILRVIPAAAAAVFLLGNLLSFTVLGENIVSAAVRIKEGSIFIRYENAADADTNEQNYYAAEMLSKCSDYGFTPMVPQTLPSRLRPDELWGSASGTADMQNVRFSMKDGERRLLLEYSYERQPDPEREYEIGTDSAALSQERICGTTVYILSGDGSQKMAQFRRKNIVYTLTLTGYDEITFRKILYSMFA